MAMPQKLGGRDLVWRFDGGDITSDGGALALKTLEERTGIVRRFAACFTDYRKSDQIEHPSDSYKCLRNILYSPVHNCGVLSYGRLTQAWASAFNGGADPLVPAQRAPRRPRPACSVGEASPSTTRQAGQGAWPGGLARGPGQRAGGPKATPSVSRPLAKVPKPFTHPWRLTPSRPPSGWPDRDRKRVV